MSSLSLSLSALGLLAVAAVVCARMRGFTKGWNMWRDARFGICMCAVGLGFFDLCVVEDQMGSSANPILKMELVT